MTTAITMRELQKMSARRIAALPHAVPVKSDGQVVAFLTPIAKASPEAIARLETAFAAAEASRTPEQQARAAEILREIGEE